MVVGYRGLVLLGYETMWIRGFPDIFALWAARYTSHSACGSAASISVRLCCYVGLSVIDEDGPINRPLRWVHTPWLVLVIAQYGKTAYNAG